MKSQNLSDFAFEMFKKKENVKLLHGAWTKGKYRSTPPLLIAQALAANLTRPEICIQKTNVYV